MLINADFEYLELIGEIYYNKIITKNETYYYDTNITFNDNFITINALVI